VKKNRVLAQWGEGAVLLEDGFARERKRRKQMVPGGEPSVMCVRARMLPDVCKPGLPGGATEKNSEKPRKNCYFVEVWKKRLVCRRTGQRPGWGCVSTQSRTGRQHGIERGAFWPKTGSSYVIATKKTEGKRENRDWRGREREKREERPTPAEREGKAVPRTFAVGSVPGRQPRKGGMLSRNRLEGKEDLPPRGGNSLRPTRRLPCWEALRGGELFSPRNEKKQEGGVTRWAPRAISTIRRGGGETTFWEKEGEDDRGEDLYSLYRGKNY